MTGQLCVCQGTPDNRKERLASCGNKKCVEWAKKGYCGKKAVVMDQCAVACYFFDTTGNRKKAKAKETFKKIAKPTKWGDAEDSCLNTQCGQCTDSPTMSRRSTASSRCVRRGLCARAGEGLGKPQSVSPPGTAPP